MAFVLAMLVLVGCGKDSGSAGTTSGDVDEIRLTGDNLREFASSLALTVEDVPDGQTMTSLEEWTTDASEIPSMPANLGTIRDGYLGLYSRPIACQTGTYGGCGVLNGVVIFRDTEAADAAFETLKNVKPEEVRSQFAQDTGASSIKTDELSIEAGNESWSSAVFGNVNGAPRSEVQVIFRRGPILAITGVIAYSSIDEGLIRDLASRLDARIHSHLTPGYIATQVPTQ